MLKWIKDWVTLKTIQHAESRFSIFVWMRVVNDRLLRLEESRTEKAVQERAEAEMLFESKFQKLEAEIGILKEHLSCIEKEGES